MCVIVFACLFVCTLPCFFGGGDVFLFPFFGGVVVKTSTKKKGGCLFLSSLDFLINQFSLVVFFAQKKWVPLPFKTGIPKT